MQSYGRKQRVRTSRALQWLWILVFQTTAFGVAPPATQDWATQVKKQVAANDLAAARQTVEERIAQAPADLEAHASRGRILAWQGHWPEAEYEYRLVLQDAPDDVDVLIALSDVLTWEQRWDEALQILYHASSLQPSEVEILVRRGRLLGSLGRWKEARAQFRQVLAIAPSNTQARAGLNASAEHGLHQLRFGAAVDCFNYTDAAHAYAVSLDSRWSTRWSTSLAMDSYVRFGQTATKFSASAAYRFTARDWLSIGGAAAHDNGVIPRNESFAEYGHGFRLKKFWVRGLETSFRQGSLWFQNAKLLTVSTTQLFYLPKEWTWMLSVTGAHTRFSDIAQQWRPSGMIKLGFPLCRRLSGNTFFATGAENYALADQIGSFSARTYGGGLRLGVTTTQEVSAFGAWQDRSTGRTQTSFGVNYGIRF